MLKQSKDKQQLSLTELILLNRNIKLREDKSVLIARNINKIEGQITQSKFQISLLSERLNELREQYKRIVVTNYKNRDSEDQMLFIFSSDDFI